MRTVTVMKILSNGITLSATFTRGEEESADDFHVRIKKEWDALVAQFDTKR